MNKEEKFKYLINELGKTYIKVEPLLRRGKAKKLRRAIEVAECLHSIMVYEKRRMSLSYREILESLDKTNGELEDILRINKEKLIEGKSDRIWK